MVYKRKVRKMKDTVSGAILVGLLSVIGWLLTEVNRLDTKLGIVATQVEAAENNNELQEIAKKQVRVETRLEYIEREIYKQHRN